MFKPLSRPFSPAGSIERLRLLSDANHLTKIAFIEFSERSGAERALFCSGLVLGAFPWERLGGLWEIVHGPGTHSMLGQLTHPYHASFTSPAGNQPVRISPSKTVVKGGAVKKDQH